MGLWNLDCGLFRTSKFDRVLVPMGWFLLGEEYLLLDSYGFGVAS